MLQKIYIILATCLLLQNTLQAHETKLEYSKNLTISDGLAHNGVTSILEDSNGYLWVGTYDGVNRYNGYEFEVYKNTYEKDILINNRVRALAEDSKGNIWIGTDEGISVYHYNQECFFNINLHHKLKTTGLKPIVRKLVWHRDKMYCATENCGIILLNENYEFVEQVIPKEVNGEMPVLYDIAVLDDDNVVLPSNTGLFHFNLKTKSLVLKLKRYLNNNTCIKYVGNNTLIVPLIRGIGIVRLKLVGGEYKFNLESEKLQGQRFHLVQTDYKGNLWLGSPFDGVRKIKPVDAFINNEDYDVEVFDKEGNLERISCIVPSKYKICWIGTYNLGIYGFNMLSNPFKKYTTEMGLEHGLASNSILHLIKYDKRKFLVSSNQGGIALFNTSKHKFEPLPFKVEERLKYSIGSLFKDSHDDIWLRSSSNAMGRVRKGSKKIESFDFKKFPELKEMRPRCYTEDKYGNVWVGDEQELYKISLDEKREVTKVDKMSKHPYFREEKLKLLRYLYADPMYDYMWVCTDKQGLLRLDTSEDKPLDEMTFQQYLRDKNNKSTISSNFVTMIVRLPNGDLWLSTERGGICKVLNSNENPQFITYTEKNGLSNNVVKSILYDSEFNLWLATNIGLSKFNTKDNTFRRFSKEDGLPFEEFWYASIKMDNGFMVLSSPNGFCYFKPKFLNNSEPLPQLEFQDLKVLNKLIQAGDTLNNRVLIKERINNVSRINLNHNENSFSIKLNSLHYLTPESHLLRYKIEPINDEWIEVNSNQRVISYDGLRPGTYLLKVMASNSLKEWTTPKEIEIVISPPFWKTIKAFILYFVFVVLVVVIVVSVILRIQKLQHNLEIEHLEHDKVKAVNEAKLRFFSNISHEIKTPITLITGPVNILAERFRANTDVAEKLQIVQRQSKKISQLVDQVHDFQRSDADLLEMHYSQFSFNAFMRELTVDFEFLANSDKKKLQLKSNGKEVFVSADKEKLEKIFNNLFSNAFKYTKETDTISVEFETKGKELHVKVSDTGRGIDKADLPHIFERFYQSQKKHSEYIGGSGIGLAFTKRLVEMHYGCINVESSLGEGAMFTVTLPIVVKEATVAQHQKEEELLSQEKQFEEKSLTINEFDASNIKVSEGLSDIKIFLVEDNSDMRNFIKDVLSRFFDVKAFVNGKHCIEAMEKEWPDIVISDVLMPEMNGFDLCHRIKSDVKTSHIPVVLLTACTSINDEIQGLELGADAYIKKPFNIQHLITMVETLIKSRNQLRERFSIDLPLKQENEEDSGNAIFLEKLYALIDKNLDNQDIELDSFAKELYLNRTHFFQKVKAITNQTPYEILKNYRLKKAAEFLVQQKLSVNEVILMTGFKSRAHFNKLFKEKYNVTPGKYSTEMQRKYN